MSANYSSFLPCVMLSVLLSKRESKTLYYRLTDRGTDNTTFRQASIQAHTTENTQGTPEDKRGQQ